MSDPEIFLTANFIYLFFKIIPEGCKTSTRSEKPIAEYLISTCGPFRQFSCSYSYSARVDVLCYDSERFGFLFLRPGKKKKRRAEDISENRLLTCALKGLILILLLKRKESLRSTLPRPLQRPSRMGMGGGVLSGRVPLPEYAFGANLIVTSESSSIPNGGLPRVEDMILLRSKERMSILRLQFSFSDDSSTFPPTCPEEGFSLTYFTLRCGAVCRRIEIELAVQEYLGNCIWQHLCRGQVTVMGSAESLSNFSEMQWRGREKGPLLNNEWQEAERIFLPSIVGRLDAFGGKAVN
ncbi:hypothetical protein CEXT_689891 [Caerostris extrusa]|uniref:Uncharacterized protein n=1 Tax=Caerostris extrusa TaxID=172846 RepID=A0AAV4T6Q3_CAEEX|nr:hypothetical protein CEXT_689891 [Caerostris extrusa]